MLDKLGFPMQCFKIMLLEYVYGYIHTTSDPCSQLCTLIKLTHSFCLYLVIVLILALFFSYHASSFL